MYNVLEQTTYILINILCDFLALSVVFCLAATYWALW